MRDEIPGALLLTIPMRHKIVPVELEHADDRSEGSGGSRVQVMQPEPPSGYCLDISQIR